MGEQLSTDAPAPAATDEGSAASVHAWLAGRSASEVRATAEIRPRLPDDIAFLAGDLPVPLLARIAAIGRRKRLAASDILIHRGHLSREAYERRLASFAGADYDSAGPNADDLMPVEIDPTDELRVPAATERSPAGDRLFISPEASGYARVAGLVRDFPSALVRPVFTRRMALRLRLFERGRLKHMARATNGLADDMPHFSATRRLTLMQALALAGLCTGVAAGFAVAPRLLELAAVAGLSVFYFAIVVVRAVLISRLDRVTIRQDRKFHPRPAAPEDFPVYSVLVALRHEEGQIAGLVAALDRLDWPKTKREILLVCEEDDPGTVAAIRAHGLPEGFALVVCPAGKPATKPRALQYALTLCSGELTVIYDAEDRPEPGQLREAWEKFSSGDPRLVCVQAPLLIHNDRQSWLTRLFAIEYRTQFCGMLPALESFGAPLPLGGTSNHFRTAHLRAAGGWDPFNVTEDADLGIRLARLGYRCGTITTPTWEEAPPHFVPWLNQRTRWLKGWLQTILVHARHPLRTAAELGLRQTLFFHLILTAIVVSMLIHPYFLVMVLWQVAMLLLLDDAMVDDPLLFGLSIFNLAGGYTTYAFFAYGVMRHSGERLSSRWLLTLPAYWLLISLAGWRAVGHFVSRPFAWEKTPHGLAKSAASNNIHK